MIHPAAHFDRLESGVVVCRLCPADCRLIEGKKGICESRFNQGGALVTDNYGEAVTLALDPIEKKPLYHFYPGTQILSTGPNCCNLGCTFCQNWLISQRKAKTNYLSPEQLVAIAKKDGSLGLAFTYTEPMVWFEYIMDTAPLARAAGLKVVLVSNGYLHPKPMEELLAVTDAFNIDLKGIRERFYLRICKGKLAPVLDNIRLIAASSAHLEITNLIIPGENDSDADISDLISFVASISDRIPLHFSAYHPDYRMDHPATPLSTMLRARRLTEGVLKYVYVGNIQGDEDNNTRCPECGHLLIQRRGFGAEIRGLTGGCCAACGAETGIRV
jgi:pyruvate formate lyase activating enzyme